MKIAETTDVEMVVAGLNESALPSAEMIDAANNLINRGFRFTVNVEKTSGRAVEHVHAFALNSLGFSVVSFDFRWAVALPGSVRVV